jgi:hypothetical protein
VYGLLWRRLPGPLAVRVATAVLLVLAVLVLLWFVIFPFIDSRYTYSPGTVGGN